MTQPNLVHRRASMADVPYIEAIERQTFGKSFGLKMLYDEVLHNQLAHYRLVELDHHRIGYFAVWITLPHAEIVQIILEEPYRRKGYGRWMMQAIMQLCQKHHVEVVSLEVRRSNQTAIAFYEQAGFQTVSIRKQYYDNGEDALLMVKPCQSSATQAQGGAT